MNEVIIPLGIVALVMTVPIISILTRHQKQMALILHNPQNRIADSQATERLEREVSELKELVAQQAILLDDLGSMHRRLLERNADVEAVKNRLGN